MPKEVLPAASLGYRTNDADCAASMLSLASVSLSTVKKCYNLIVDVAGTASKRFEFVFESKQHKQWGNASTRDLAAAFNEQGAGEAFDALMTRMEGGESIHPADIRKAAAMMVVESGRATLHNRRMIEQAKGKQREQILTKTEKGHVLLPASDWTPSNRAFAKHTKVI